MVYQFRGRSRTNSGSSRGRGKPFRGRGRDSNKGQGLLITLNSRNDSQDSWDDRPISNKHDMSRRDNTNYEGSYEDSHDYVQSFEKRRKMEDDYDRNRSLDKIDLSAESESLRITFGSERFHREREQSPMRSAPLSERLGPPVDNSPSGSGSRYRDKETYADDGGHDRSRRESSWYNRQERERTEKSYIEKRDQHDYRQYDRGGRSPEHHDWKSSSSFNRSSSNSDHRPRDDSRYDKREGRYRDDRSSRERYNRDDGRNKERKHGRYDDAERDKQHRRDYPREFSGRDDSSRNSLRSRHSSIDSSERDKYQDDFDRDSDRRKRDSIERSHESMTRHGEKSESSHYSTECYKDTPRSESEIFRHDISNPDQILGHASERPLFSARMNEILDSATVSQSSPKPLKSILKKKSEPTVDQPNQGNQSSFDSQVTDFLKRLQSPMTRATDIQDNFNIISNTSFETTQEMKTSTSHAQGHKLDLTIGSQPLGGEMDVDDEEEFLYGQKSRLLQQSHQDTLFPVVESNLPRSESRPKQSLISESVDKDSSIHSVSSANLPSWMRPLSKSDEVEAEKKDDDDMDKTVQNILKSIGFNFDLSKRMQELAKLKKQKEEEAQFPINKNASFLGAGISSADLKAKLFSTEGKTAGEEKGTRRRSSGETAIETRHKPFTTDHISSDQIPNQDMSSRDIRLSDDSDVVCSMSVASRYTNQHTPSHLQEKSPASQFHVQPTPYPSYPETYHHAFSHALPKEHMHMMPPSNPNYHVPMPYNYMSYPPPGFPHAVPHDTPHLSMPHPPQPPHKAKRSSGSSNLTVIPLSTIEKKVERKNSEDEVKSQAKKREREKSPEYSRIVIAPKSKETRDKSPVRKALKRQKEDDKEKRIKPRSPKEVTEVAMKAEQTDSRSVKQEPKVTPVSAREQQVLLKESEERKKKLRLLEKELGKLKKHQNEIMRRRQRQRDGHKDPLLVQNSKLQEEITAQIRMLRKASEMSSNLLSKDVGKKYSTPASLSTEESVKEDTTGNCKEEKVKSTRGSSVERHEFYDPGNHWCGVCNYVSPSLLDHLTHLQSRKHKQKCDPYDRPWLSETLNEKKLDKAGSVEITALKGVEFLMSTDAFYCTLCRAFTGDVSCAEAHIKSEEHYMKYKNHIKQNEFYEKRYTLEKTAALSHVKETSEQRKGSEVREMTRAKRSTEDTEEENNSDKDTCKTKNLVEKRKEMRDNSCSKRHKEHEGDQLKGDNDNDDELENSKDDDESMDLSEDSKNGDSGIANSSKNQKVEKDEQKDDSKQEEASKGKIAIKLTGKTGIKPQSKVLPPWTPVTKRLQTVKIKKTEVVPQKKAISKPENDPPSSLDTFLTIGGLTTKKLPVYKLRSGTVKKPLNKRAVSPEKKQADGKDSEDMEDMKLMGIEGVSSQIAPKKAPPPRSQNLSLPKEGSSSSAQELYTVFYQDVSKEKSMYDINLDDIPIPPPPPQPPVPYKEVSSEIPLASGNEISASSSSNLSPEIAVTCQTTLNEGKTSGTQKSEAIPFVKDMVEDNVKTSGFPDPAVSGTSDTEDKSRGLVDKEDDTCLIGVEVCTPDNEGNKVQSDGTNNTEEKLENVTEKKEDQCFENIDVCSNSGEGNTVKSDGTNETGENNEELVDKKEVTCLNVEDSTICNEGKKVQGDDTNKTGEKSTEEEAIPSERLETLVPCGENEVQSDGADGTEVKNDNKEDICSENVETMVPCEGCDVQSVGIDDTEDKNNKKDDTCSEEVEALVPCTEESKVQSEDTSYTEEQSGKKDHICYEEVEAPATSGEMRMVQCDGTNDAEEKNDKEDICSVEFNASITTDDISKMQSDTTGLGMENTSGDEIKEISQHLTLEVSSANMQVTTTHVEESEDSSLHVDSINQTESHNVKSESENVCESVDSSDLSVKASDCSSMTDKSAEKKPILPSETEDISTQEAEKGDDELCLSSDVKCSDVLGEEEPSSTVNSPVAEETGECAKEDEDIEDDCASVCSGNSMLMGSDFEVVDEYEAD